jgi:hypothetical protein
MLFHRLLRETPAREKLYDKTQTYLPCLLCFLFTVRFSSSFYCAGENDKSKAHMSRLLFFLFLFFWVCVCVGVGVGVGVCSDLRLPKFMDDSTSESIQASTLVLCVCVCVCLCLCVCTHMYVELVGIRKPSGFPFAIV